MRHIICENYVEQQLANAKKKRPRFLMLFAFASWVMAFIGIIGFIVNIIATVFTMGRTNFISVPSAAFSTGIGYFAVAFIGIILFIICTFILGVRRVNQLSIRQWVSEVAGGDEVGRLEAGVKGEEAVVKELQGLDDRWVLFSGVVLEGALGDIDHVLVGPPGVFTLEVKNWSGKIEYSNDTSTWTRTKPRQFQSEVLKDPAEQVVQLSGVLGAALKEKAIPVVVFVNPNSTVNASDHPRATVLTLAQLRKWVTSQPARFTLEKVDALAAILNKLAKKSADQTPPAVKVQSPAPAAAPKAAASEPPKPDPRAGRGCRIAVPIILVLSLVAVVFVYFAVKSIGITQPSGCTKAVTTYIRSGPFLNDELLGTASKGTCFNFDGRTIDGYWVRITGINGFRGGWTTVNYINLKQEEIKNLPVVK